jgi:hypothetical protein
MWLQHRALWLLGSSMHLSALLQLLCSVTFFQFATSQFSDTPCPVVATDLTPFRPDEVARIHAACGASVQQQLLLMTALLSSSMLENMHVS